MRSTRQLDQIVRSERAIAARGARIEALQARQTQALSDVRSRKAALALAALREAGLLDLPIADLAAVLSSISTERAVRGSNITEPAMARPEPDAVSDGTGPFAVAVRISRNVGDDRRAVLTETRLRWNGKRGAWVGDVDRPGLAQLQAVFAGKITIATDAAPADWGRALEAAERARDGQEPPAPVPAAPAAAEADAAPAPVQSPAGRAEAAPQVSPATGKAIGLGEPSRPRLPPRPFMTRPGGLPGR